SLISTFDLLTTDSTSSYSWSQCSVTCSNGTQQRSRQCTAAAHGGSECRGPWAESRECSNPECTANGQWNQWGHWSGCSKSCDGGWERRTRTCQGAAITGQQCDGSSEEVRRCSEQRISRNGPWNARELGAGWKGSVITLSSAIFILSVLENPPYEICPEDYVMSMVWKRTPAGDLAFNQCPLNATGTTSRRCSLSLHGVAFWEQPSFARCISNEYRHLQLSIKEHLAKGQRMLAGDGMSQVTKTLLDLTQRKNFYAGDLLMSVEILRNVTDTFKRASYIPASDGVQNFFQIVSNLLDEENKEKWEDAQQIYPGSIELMQVIEDFIHIVGMGMMDFQNSYLMTGNVVASIQKLPAASVLTDINFPMKGRKGMVDWARNSEDRVVIPKSIFTPVSSKELDESSVFVLGATILSVKLHFLFYGFDRQAYLPQSPPLCRNESLGTWSTQGCKTVLTDASHTKCLCDRLSTFAILAQQPREIIMESSGAPSVTLIVGSGLSCLALITLAVVYAALWRYIRSERSIILINFCLSIISSNILILVGQTQTHNKSICTTTTAFLHFFFLASFCWVLTEAWQSYMAVTGKIRTRLIRKRFLCLGWGLPALVVATSVGFTRTRGYGTDHYCWLSLEGGLLYAFVGPAAAVVLVNMVIGILVFNKLVSRDGILDKKLKHRAGASLWSSCVVLPLLALTWMSAVLAMTDKRSILFQILFAVFDSLQGFVIVMVHCILRREVRNIILGTERNDDFEKDVDIACRSVLHKDIGPCRAATITGTLSRISLNDDEEEKGTNPEGLSYSTLPGNVISKVIIQQPTGLHMPMSMNETVYLCTDDNLRGADMDIVHPQERMMESDYIVMPRSSVNTQPSMKEESKMNIGMETLPHERLLHYKVNPEFNMNPPVMDQFNMNLDQHLAPQEHMQNLPFEPRTAVKNFMASERKSRYSDLDFEKVMHTRKRHMELFQELNQKFQTLDRFRDIPNTSSMVSIPGLLVFWETHQQSTLGALTVDCDHSLLMHSRYSNPSIGLHQIK
uniref:Adhesion G protein-coupled receptor B3 n=1 Tax=Equus asinus asinus TaxID=83772 RepID=A0A8C4PHD1_EQUAS